MTEFGSTVEQNIVREALLILKQFNRKLEECRVHGIKCRLEERGSGYLAEFTQTRTIMPAAVSEQKND